MNLDEIRKANHLTLIKEIAEKDKSGYRIGLFLCDCGNKKKFRIEGVFRKIRPSFKSCGCLTGAMISKARTKHGQRKNKTPDYTAWINMKDRCYNRNHVNYKYWGGRGVSVCNRWRNSFENFFNDMGPGNGLVLDRVDVMGDYEPGNCRWATQKQSARNRRNTRYVVIAGKRHGAADLIESLGFGRHIYWNRKSCGWSDEKIFNTPIKKPLGVGILVCLKCRKSVKRNVWEIRAGKKFCSRSCSTSYRNSHGV